MTNLNLKQDPYEDKRFMDLMELVFESEGGFSNNPNDRGGMTNLGISQIAYKEYCTKRELTEKSVKYLTKEEAVLIYYEDYYLKVGADKLKDVREAYLLFDTAVNFSPKYAIDFWDKSGHDFYKMLKIRTKAHKDTVLEKPSQVVFLKGWLNRVNRIEYDSDKLLEKYPPSNYKELTPFDDAYKGELKINKQLSPKEKTHSRNKYLYLLEKKQPPLGVSDEIDKKFQGSLSRKVIDKLSAKEFEAFDSVIMNKIQSGQIHEKRDDINSFVTALLPDSNIYTKEFLGVLDDFDDHLKNINVQNSHIGIPTENELLANINTHDVYVKEYVRKDGTHVNSYVRSKPQMG